MRAGRLEVLDLLRKWKDEGLLVRWDGSFANFAFTSRGSIVSANETEIRIRSSDGKAEIAIRVQKVLEFHYADSRTVTGHAKKYQECIVAFFSPVPEHDDADTIALAALDPSYSETEE